MERILGIIGGAGVAATNKLNEMVEERFTTAGAYRDAHHPQIVTFQATQAPSRSMFLEGRGESFIPAYIDAGRKLKAFGASTLCMACNTAHYAIESIQNEVGVPFINIIRETVIKIKKEKGLRIGILASDGCINGKVYEKYLSEICPEKEIVYLNREWQQKVTFGINTVKSSQRLQAYSIFHDVCDHFVEDLHADIVVLGCTDISVCYNKNSFHRVPVIESLDVLAEKIYQEFSPCNAGNAAAKKFYDELSRTIQNPEETKNKRKDTSHLDAQFIEKYAGPGKTLLDVGSGTGLILNRISGWFDRAVAVERCEGLARFILQKENLQLIHCDIFDLHLEEQFDVVTMFAVMNYFNEEESGEVYNKIFPLVKDGGTLLVKHQMGVEETVEVNGYSEELRKHYYSQYRTIQAETALLKRSGFHNISVVDIYPQEYNRWSNTHFYALVCTKS